MSKELHSISGMTDPEEFKPEAERVVQELLDSFEYKVFGDEPLDEIIALARDDWEADAEHHAARGHTRPPDDRLAVNFLRH